MMSQLSLKQGTEDKNVMPGLRHHDFCYKMSRTSHQAGLGKIDQRSVVSVD